MDKINSNFNFVNSNKINLQSKQNLQTGETPADNTEFDNSKIYNYEKKSVYDKGYANLYSASLVKSSPSVNTDNSHKPQITKVDDGIVETDYMGHKYSCYNYGDSSSMIMAESIDKTQSVYRYNKSDASFVSDLFGPNNGLTYSNSISVLKEQRNCISYNKEHSLYFNGNSNKVKLATTQINLADSYYMKYSKNSVSISDRPFGDEKKYIIANISLSDFFANSNLKGVKKFVEGKNAEHKNPEKAKYLNRIIHKMPADTLIKMKNNPNLVNTVSDKYAEDDFEFAFNLNYEMNTAEKTLSPENNYEKYHNFCKTFESEREKFAEAFPEKSLKGINTVFAFSRAIANNVTNNNPPEEFAEDVKILKQYFPNTILAANAF